MYYNTKASGARIRELRLAKKLDQIELAELLNVSHGYIGRIESGKKGCSVDLLIQLSEIFNAWASEGAGLNTITVRLNDAGYLPPNHYKNTQGIITHENLMGNGNWNTRTVTRILHAQVYTGDLVQGRTKIVDHQQVEAGEMEWTVVHGIHEAIMI